MACISRLATAILSGETELALGTIRVKFVLMEPIMYSYCQFIQYFIFHMSHVFFEKWRRYLNSLQAAEDEVASEKAPA